MNCDTGGQAGVAQSRSLSRQQSFEVEAQFFKNGEDVTGRVTGGMAE